MAKAKETVSRTLIVALVLSIVFSVVVSTAAVLLRPAQIQNQNLDIKTNILSAAGMLESGSSAEQIEEAFARFDVRLVDLDTGEFVEPSDVGVQDPMKYDMYKAASDPQMSTNIPSSEDKAGIKRRPNVAKVYTMSENGQINRVVLPIHGYGLWSTLYGFISLEGDLNTIEGLGFYAHAETPGLAVRWTTRAGSASGLVKRSTTKTVPNLRCDWSRAASAPMPRIRSTRLMLSLVRP